MLALTAGLPAPTNQEIFAEGIARRVEHARAAFSSQTMNCEPAEEKFFLFSLKRKLDAGQTLAQIRKAGAVPLDAHLSVAEAGYSFDVDARSDDAAILAGLRSGIIAYLEGASAILGQPLPAGFDTAQSTSRNRQEKAFSENALAAQKRSASPLVNGWFVRATCTSAIRLQHLVADDVLAIEPSSATRRGMAIPLETYASE